MELIERPLTVTAMEDWRQSSAAGSADPLFLIVATLYQSTRWVIRGESEIRVQESGKKESYRRL